MHAMLFPMPKLLCICKKPNLLIANLEELILHLYVWLAALKVVPGFHQVTIQKEVNEKMLQEVSL